MSPEGEDRSARRDPEALLRHVQAEERARHRGELKVFLGYTSGVGKSFRLFDEGRRRRERGEDVVIAAAQPHSPPEIADLIRQLEVVAPREIAGVLVIDVPALLKRRPQVCLVDGIAYDNPPGSRHHKRYEDVEELLEADISVLTSINLEYVDEQQDFVRSVTGRVPAETVPQRFVTAADEVVVVDAPPEACLPKGGQDQDADSATLTHRLSLLRERALLLTADVVEHQLESYLGLHGIQSSWGTQERILVCMTPRANAAAMLASGRRNADRFHGELFAVYVNQPHLTHEDRTALERNMTLARAQHAHIEVLDGKNPVSTILAYARQQGMTQIFVGHNLRRTWRARIAGSPLDQLIRDAEGIDVRVFPH